MAEHALADLVRPELDGMAAYVPAQGDYRIRLDANEAPALLAQDARERLARAAKSVAWERYPDATHRALREAIARRCNVPANHVMAGVGSDEVIALLLTALVAPRGGARQATVVTTTPTFVMYRTSARARGLRVVEVPLDEHWDLSVDGLVRAIEVARPNLVFIASPNNPTGSLMSSDRLESVIRAAASALVVIDEAYVDYARTDQLGLLRRHPNVAVLRTLSKIGFAALRVGWILAPPELVAEIDKARQPYNLPTVSQELGILVLDELRDAVDAVVRQVVAERKRLTARLVGLSGVAVAPSDANFLWIGTRRPAGEVRDALAARSIAVRSFHARGGRLSKHLRVTIGHPHENDALADALAEVT